MICRGIPGSRVENMQKADGAMLIINIVEKGEEAMAKYYDGCPRCGAEIDDDDTVVVVTTEKENTRNR